MLVKMIIVRHKTMDVYGEQRNDRRVKTIDGSDSMI
jgi:hypothetical protein